MLYRIDSIYDNEYLVIFPNLDQKQPIDNGVIFIGAPKGQVYGDKWVSLYLDFMDSDFSKNGLYPDVSEYYSKLFLSVKAYNCLHKILAPYCEFLPVTYELGDGYLFNPSTVLEPLKESIVYGENSRHMVMQCDFDADAPMIFIGITGASHLFIGDVLYNAIKKYDLKGLDIFANQFTLFEEPEGGYKGDMSMPGYENEA